MLRAILLVAAVVAPVLGQLQGAFQLSDVCSIEVAVIYDGSDADPRSTTFSLSTDRPESELSLPPGNSIQIEVGMKACDGSGDTPAAEPPSCNPDSSVYDESLCESWHQDGGLAFKGTSPSFSITGEADEGDIDLNIIAVDQAIVYDPIVVEQASSFTFPLIITGLSASPSTLKYGESSTIQVQSLDISGKGVNGYLIKKQDGFSLEASAFTPAYDVNDKACVGQTTCNELGFNAVAGPNFSDQGNIPFTVSAYNSEDVEETLNGNLVIDPRGTVKIGLTVFNIPVITTTASDLTSQSGYYKDIYADPQADQSSSTTAVLEVEDEDFLVQPAGMENLTYSVTWVSPSTPIDTREGLDRFNCEELSTASYTAPAEGSKTASFSLTLSIPEGLDSSNTAITACISEIVFYDNSAGMNPEFNNAPSQKFTITTILYPPESTFNAATDAMSIPLVRRMIVSPSKAVDGEQVEIIVDFDGVPNTGLEIGLVDGPTIEAARQSSVDSRIVEARRLSPSEAVILGNDDPVGPGSAVCDTSCPCDAGCRYVFTVTPTSTEFRNFYLFMKSVGASESEEVWESITIESVEARRRRAATGGDSAADLTTPFETSIENGVLKTSLSPEFRAKMGTTTTTAATTTAATDAKDDGANDNGDEAAPAPTAPAESAGAFDFTIVAGAAGGAVALIAFVAFLAVKRSKSQLKRISPAPEACASSPVAESSWI